MHSLEHLARTPSRRTVLQSGIAGAFVLGFHLPARAVNEPEQPPDSTQGKFAPNAFIRIDRSGAITLVMPQVEMGQGVYTAIPMILADELDADFSKVVLQHAPPNEKLYANPTFGDSGYWQFQFHSRVLETVARGGRCSTADAGSGRRTTVAGRSGELLDI